MQLINERTRTVLARDVELADSRKARRRGLLGRDRLEPDAALMLVPCAAVHTAFMRFSIDVLFLDRDGRVVKMVSGLRPWRVAACVRARSIVELPTGCIARCGVVLGDHVYVAPMRQQRWAS